MNCFLGKRRWRQENGPTWNSFQKLPFLDIYWRKSTHSLFVHGHSSLVHIWFTPSERPKGFVIFFYLKKLDHESWTMGKGHLTWSDIMVHGVNRTLYLSCLRLWIWKGRWQLMTGWGGGGHFRQKEKVLRVQVIPHSSFTVYLYLDTEVGIKLNLGLMLNHA